MKKIRKIVALALATVMMMAMSITAFAEEDKLVEVSQKSTTSTIKVTNISTRETSEVTIYQVAHVDFDENTVKVNDWAKDVYGEKTTDFTGFTSEVLATADQKYVKSATPTNGVVEFADVEAGVYYVAIAGTLYSYNPMLIRAYGVTSNGEYSGVPVKDATLVAKGSTSNTVKTTEEKNKFVQAGEVVPFTIKTNIPYDANTFVVKDQSTNLTLSKAEVTIFGLAPFEAEWVPVEGKPGLSTIDLSDYVEDYKNAEVIITYTGTVGDAIDSEENGYAYKNSAYTNINGTDTDTNPPEVVGWTGTIEITKTKSDKTSPLAGATFNILDSEGNAVKFVKNSNGEYVFSTANDASADLVTDDNGKIVATGLDEGTYNVKETAAPTGYSVDPDDHLATITNTSADSKNCVVPISIIDPDLIRLPFTGGMGTTIFTVLGVAIMAMASALYFATKKKATK